MAEVTTATIGFKAAFQEAFDGTPVLWDRLAMDISSDTIAEEYGWLDDLPAVREWVGDRHIHGLKTDGYRLKNVEFELTIAVKRRAVETDRYNQYGPRFRAMGERARKFPDREVFKALKAGFSAKCFDGQYFFDSDHPVGLSTYSNSGGGSGAPWFLLDTRGALKPLIWQTRVRGELTTKESPQDDNVFMRNEYLYGWYADAAAGYGLWQTAYGSKQTLDETALNAAYASMTSVKDDAGEALGVMPNILMVPPTLRATALELVKAGRKADGADNINSGLVEVVVVPELA